MTNREFYTAVSKNEITADVIAFALDSIDKLDKRNEKRASTPSKTAVANEPIKAQIAEFLGNHTAATATDIATALDITTQKASALCRQMVEAGVLDHAVTKVPKVGKRVAYSVHIAE